MVCANRQLSLFGPYSVLVDFAVYNNLCLHAPSMWVLHTLKLGMRRWPCVDAWLPNAINYARFPSKGTGVNSQCCLNLHMHSQHILLVFMLCNYCFGTSCKHWWSCFCQLCMWPAFCAWPDLLFVLLCSFLYKKCKKRIEL